MQAETVELLACPACNGRLSADEPMSLLCSSCAQRYPIRDGIPILLRGAARGNLSAVGKNFGYKWMTYPEFLHTYERRFLDQIHPLKVGSFSGKAVLEACCGIGIPDFFIAQAGARHVVGFDLSDSVFIARDRCRDFSNVDFVQADMMEFPFRREFDVAICLAALHHLPLPKEGFRRLVSALRPGGMVVLWVYGREGTRFVRWVVEPLRRMLATRCPLALLHLFSSFLAFFLWIFVHGFYGPLASLEKSLPGVRRLPLFEYAKCIHNWPFKQLREMVFDQLLSPITNYLSRDELELWFREGPFSHYEISPLNGMSWRAYGVIRNSSS